MAWQYINMERTVSVIIPTRGLRGEWLKEAFDSIDRQTKQPVEVITAVGNDGVCDRINRAISSAKGEYILILSDDDILEDNFLEITSEEMEKQGVDIVATFIKLFGEDEGMHGPEKHPFFSSLFKKSIWEKVGGFDDEMLQMADVDFWVRCFNAGARWGITPRTFYNYRKHGDQDSGTANWDIARDAYLKKHGKFID